MSVYQLWVIKNQPFSVNYAALSAAQQKELTDQEAAASKRVGAVNLLYCDSTWANEAYIGWGVTQFPDVAARIQSTREMLQFGWFRVLDSFSILAAADFRSRLSKEEEAAMMKAHDESLAHYKSFAWLLCDSYWSDDQYPAFGVNVYASIEAEQYHKAELAKMHWEKYYDSFAILGTKSM
jgi:hypothetical protein